MRGSARFKPTPAAVLNRLALYHCLMSDWLSSGKNGSVTSRKLADTLGVTDATVRSDLSYLGEEIGVRGLGYSTENLKRELEKFLSLPTFAPVAFLGTAKTIDSILSFFSPEKFGFTITTFFSEDPNDTGATVNGCEIQPIGAIPSTVGSLGIKTAIIATDPSWAQYSVDLLAKAGIKGILILTPAIAVKAPDEVKIIQAGIPCNLKILFYHASLAEEQDQDSFDIAL